MEMGKNGQWRYIYQILEYYGVIELYFIVLSLGKPEGRNITLVVLMEERKGECQKQ